MLIGYARVSTDDQTLDLQLDALKATGCQPRRIYTDTASGAKTDRLGLVKALEVLREGDTLVVWRLDRLGRSLSHLIEVVEALKGRSVSFRSLTESIDTTTPSGELVFHIFAVLAQFERNLIRERTMAGLKAARARRLSRYASYSVFCLQSHGSRTYLRGSSCAPTSRRIAMREPR